MTNPANIARLNLTLLQLAGMQSQCQILKESAAENPCLTEEERARLQINLETAKIWLDHSMETVNEIKQRSQQ